MLRQISSATLVIIFSLCANAQQLIIDSLVLQLSKSKNDTSRLVCLRSIARAYGDINPDSGYYFAEESLKLARKLSFKLDEAGAYNEIAYAFGNKGNYPRALQSQLTAKAILEDVKSEDNAIVGKFEGDDATFFRTASPHHQRLNQLALIHQALGVLYIDANNFEKARQILWQGLQTAVESGSVFMQGTI